MKLLLIGFSTKKYMPYLNKYLTVLEENKITYDIVFFNREKNIINDCRENEIYFNYNMKIKKNIFTKILPYLKYFIFLKKIINKKKYDKIIFLTTAPAIFLFWNCLWKYKNNYIFDYRDYTFEKNKFYKKIVQMIVKNSFASFISSKGFEIYTGKSEKIYLNHNIANKFIEEEEYLNLKNQKNIKIGFIGCVRYFDVNSELIRKLKNQKNISLLYAGLSYDDCNLKKYCLENDIKNVEIIDEYNNEEKEEIYKKITFINSIYSLKSPEVIQAIPNRLYDAAIYKKPIIVSKGTYLEKIVKFYDIGISVDVYKDDILEEINTYIEKFNPIIFNNNCKRFLENVYNDEKKWRDIIESFLWRS